LASFSKFSWLNMRSANWSTSSGIEIHFIPGNRLIAEAQKRMMVMSRVIVRRTLGCSSLIATDEVGTAS